MQKAAAAIATRPPLVLAAYFLHMRLESCCMRQPQALLTEPAPAAATLTTTYPCRISPLMSFVRAADTSPSPRKCHLPAAYPCRMRPLKFLGHAILWWFFFLRLASCSLRAAMGIACTGTQTGQHVETKTVPAAWGGHLLRSVASQLLISSGRHRDRTACC